ncbi:MAG: L,D-transpeptidase [Leptolyngbyaceae cyanobacterium CSU_1_4]|nr:L,D-transpeptidase [Leptolyngbyaceae cyanobacterium CSU_1_4]
MWMSFATVCLMVASQMGAFSALSAKALSSSPFSSQTSSTAEEKRSQLVVDLGDRKVYLYVDGNIQVGYDIAVGRAGWETPPGNFSILNMQLNPTWQHPFTGDVIPTGVGNPLGSRWIGFWTDGTHQIGFHGTEQTDLLGQAVSHGCIRMRDGDIQALYEQVAIGDGGQGCSPNILCLTSFCA